MDQRVTLIETAKLLIQRLERISPDSIWARRSSGHRGALLRWVERLEENEAVENKLDPCDMERLQSLIEAGFQLLEKAARELRR